MRWYINFAEDDLLEHVDSVTKSACGSNIRPELADAILDFMQVVCCDRDVAASFLRYIDDPKNGF